jgi:hypothetical protein
LVSNYPFPTFIVDLRDQSSRDRCELNQWQLERIIRQNAFTLKVCMHGLYKYARSQTLKLVQQKSTLGAFDLTRIMQIFADVLDNAWALQQLHFIGCERISGVELLDVMPTNVKQG